MGILKYSNCSKTVYKLRKVKLKYMSKSINQKWKNWNFQCRYTLSLFKQILLNIANTHYTK